MTAHQQAVDPPRLWRVEALNALGAVQGAVLVCADRVVRGGFSQASAEIDGQPCAPLKGQVLQDGLHAVRCELNGRRFGLTVNREGDPNRDFTTAFALHTLDGGPQASARQVRRYREVGPCPEGWRIGDQARLGDEAADGIPTVNALAGVWPVEPEAARH